jgi:hypothetical protein
MLSTATGSSINNSNNSNNNINVKWEKLTTSRIGVWRWFLTWFAEFSSQDRALQTLPEASQLRREGQHTQL